MENTENENSTASNLGELEKIFDGGSFDFDAENNENRDLARVFKLFLRILRRKIRTAFRNDVQKNFTNILYLTLDCPAFTPNSLRRDNPLEYITQMRKQYPENDIRVLIPLIGLDSDAKVSKKISIEIEGEIYHPVQTSLNCEFFLQNKKQEAVLYKFPKDVLNIQVYGIYCEGFSDVKKPSDMTKLKYLAPFIKAARLFVKDFGKLGFDIDIVHVEEIPYYLGAEFEIKFPQGVKILQTIKDFAKYEYNKPELFWAAINLVDSNGLRKLCRDGEIKKYLAELFNLEKTNRATKISECIESIYENYYRFRKYVEQDTNPSDDAIFRRLNKRTAQLLPQFSSNEPVYNEMLYTIKNVDFWAVYSKSYYKEIFDKPEITGSFNQITEKTKNRSFYLPYCCDLSAYNDEKPVYQKFTVEDFRENRIKNKLALLKEFNYDRIKTNFVDSTLFKDEDVLIEGNLDYFYNAPLLFANPDNDIFAEGIDILFNSILKLFEYQKNIQVIICIENGLKNNFVNSWVKFLSENRQFSGHWVFIDGKLNLPKFLASADIFLSPRRINTVSPEHLLAMRYGCVPVAAGSGILNDNILSIFDDINLGCGFKTEGSLIMTDDNPEEFLSPLIKAINFYNNNPSGWNLVMKNCMEHQSGWDFKALEKYNNIYQKLL